MGFNRKKHLEDNIRAIETAFELERVGAGPSEGQAGILKQYSGFGGLKCILNPCEKAEDIERWKKTDKELFGLTASLFEAIRKNTGTEYARYGDSLKRSVLTAFFTPEEITGAIALSFVKSGIAIKSMLDPSAGTGAFGRMFKRHAAARVTSMEKEPLSGKILSLLFPDDTVYCRGFEEIPPRLTGSFDIVSSNIPFGDINVFDPAFLESRDKTRKRSCRAVHTYFFIKAVDCAREGGIIAFITSRGLMDSPSSRDIRKWLMERCNLLSVVRLPNNLFTDFANTEAGSDLVILQKNSGKETASPFERDFITTRQLGGGYNVNNYFTGFERVVYTKARKGTDPYGKPCPEFIYEKPLSEMAKVLEGMVTCDLAATFDPGLYHSNAPGQAPTVISATGGETEKMPEIEPEPEPLVSLYDLFGIPCEERSQINKKQKRKSPLGDSLEGKDKPYVSLFTGEDPFTLLRQGKNNRLYEGNIEKFYKQGTLLWDGGQIGFLDIRREIENGKEVLAHTFCPVELTTPDAGKLSAYIPLRDAYFRLFAFEQQHRAESAALREGLNNVYASFTATYGDVNSKDNLKAVMLDSHGPEILALEYYENGYKKLADIFVKPVSFEREKPVLCDAHGSLAASLNKYGAVNLPYMSHISSLEKDVLLSELDGQVYYNPLSRAYEVAARFVAGDVISKADAIEEYILSDPERADAIESRKSLAVLREAAPPPVLFGEMDINFGERWVPVDYYSRYASRIFSTPVRIDYYVDIDNFDIKAEYDRTIEIREKYAVRPDDHKDISGLTLLSHALVNTTPKITKGTGRHDLHGREIRVPDLDAMHEASCKIEEIRSGFTAWLEELPQEKKDKLQDIYNRKFNARVIPRYDGSFQTFPGLHLKELGIPCLYESQYNSVWQALLGEGVIVDNSVGTGKSLTMCMIAHEMKRLGMVVKPLLICLKTNVTAIAGHFSKAYPSDKILFPSEKDFEPGNRKNLFYRMQNSAWDAIILTHEQFFKLPQSLEIQRDTLQKELDSVNENLRVWETLNKQAASGAMMNGLQKRKENLEARQKWISGKMQKRRDGDVIDFKTMGIDHILIDESQEFKNAPFDTRYRNVAGMGDPKGSQRALNLLYAIRTIQERKGKDMCATFLTATTISNSLVELYLIFKYLRPRALENQGIRTFDAWAAVFAKKSSDFEFTVTNGIKSRERFRYFKNVPELALFYNEVTNYSTSRDIKIDKPESNVVLFTTKSTPEQGEFQNKLVEFARTGDGELIGKPGRKYEGSQSGRMLVVTDLARKAAIDMRLIDPEKYHDHPENKLSEVAGNVASFYYKYNEHRGTQMVFLDIGTYKPDRWNAYGELKRKLVEDHRIPPHEIRFIQEAKDLAQRDRIKEDFRNGAVRILLGHTKSLGTAMDCPDKGVCSHSVNMPWTPKDLEQRDGRLARKGNLVAKLHLGNRVDHILYASENSLDTYMFNLLQNKQNFITQLKTNSLGTRTLDEGAMDTEGNISYSEYVAILSGNTDLLDRVKLERKISVLEGEHKNYNKQKNKTRWNLKSACEDLEKVLGRLDGIRRDMEKIDRLLPKGPQGNRPNPLVLDGFEFNGDPELTGKKLIGISKAMNTGGEYFKIGSILDFNILVITSEFENLALNKFFVEGTLKYSFNNGQISQDPHLAATNFIRALDKIPNLVSKYEKDKEKLEKEIAVMREIVDAPWRKEEELKRMKKEFVALDRKIQHALGEIEGPSNISGGEEYAEVSEEAEVLEPA